MGHMGKGDGKGFCLMRIGVINGLTVVGVFRIVAVNVVFRYRAAVSG
jgi:hypothetical protein